MPTNTIQKGGIFAALLVMNSSVVASPTKVPSLGDIAGRFLAGSDFITRLILVACIAVGLMMIMLSIGHFKVHRENPKLMPLGRPVMYVVLGFCLVILPFFGRIFGTTGSILELKSHQEENSLCPVDIDAPLEFGNEFNH